MQEELQRLGIPLGETVDGLVNVCRESSDLRHRVVISAFIDEWRAYVAHLFMHLQELNTQMEKFDSGWFNRSITTIRFGTLYTNPMWIRMQPVGLANPQARRFAYLSPYEIYNNEADDEYTRKRDDAVLCLAMALETASVKMQEWAEQCSIAVREQIYQRNRDQIHRNRAQVLLEASERVGRFSRFSPAAACQLPEYPSVALRPGVVRKEVDSIVADVKKCVARSEAHAIFSRILDVSVDPARTKEVAGIMDEVERFGAEARVLNETLFMRSVVREAALVITSFKAPDVPPINPEMERRRFGYIQRAAKFDAACEMRGVAATMDRLFKENSVEASQWQDIFDRVMASARAHMRIDTPTLTAAMERESSILFSHDELERLDALYMRAVGEQARTEELELFGRSEREKEILHSFDPLDVPCLPPIDPSVSCTVVEQRYHHGFMQCYDGDRPLGGSPMRVEQYLMLVKGRAHDAALCK